MSVYGILGECVRVIYYFHFDYKKRNNGSVQQQVFLVYLLPVLLVYYYENQKMDSREYVHKFFFQHFNIIGWVDLMQICNNHSGAIIVEMKMLHNMSHSFRE